MKFEKYIGKNIYFLGIGGISMYAIALFLKSKGANVFGYDKTHSDTTDFLERNQIKVFYEPNLENSKNADICICTAAIASGNEEYDNVIKNNIKIIYRGECLGDIIDESDNSIGVSGTHGKSTTSGILSEIFLANKEKNPTIFMGAILPSLNAAYKIGDTKNMIFEACEYKDSFLSFRPKISIILNVSLDHTDYFENLDRMKQSFIDFAKNSDYVIANIDCSNAYECAKKSQKNIITYSINNKKADFYAENIYIKDGKTYFNLINHNRLLCECELGVVGKHNLSNALAASAAAFTSGIDIQTLKKGLKNFKGIKRRFELLGKINDSLVFDDYAHHPDEIKATLNAAIGINPKRIICVFQPHTYTRLSYFFDEFKEIFNEKYDNIELIPIFIPTYAAREKNLLGYDTEKLASTVKKSVFFNDFNSTANFINSNAKKDDIVILMGAGDVTNISKLLIFDK